MESGDEEMMEVVVEDVEAEAEAEAEAKAEAFKVQAALFATMASHQVACSPKP